MTTLLLVSTFGPLVVIALTEALREDSLGRIRARSVWDCYREYLVVYSMVLLFTEAAKVAFGEHRPHFLATCVPDTGQTCQSGTFVEEYRCTNKDVGDYFLVDSSRSFPSGHASISVVAGTYSAVSEFLFPFSVFRSFRKNCLRLSRQQQQQPFEKFTVPCQKYLHRRVLSRPIFLSRWWYTGGCQPEGQADF